MSGKNVAIVGAGIAGLAAAYDLLNSNHRVTLYEASDHAGGLAAGFRADGWDWHLEKYYHHLFQSDKEIIGLVEELGIRDKLFFPRPTTSFYYQGEIFPFDSPLRILKYPPFDLVSYARFGAVTALLRYLPLWRVLEKHTADAWMRRWYGDKVYEASWRPALINKFGPHYKDVNMAWMWARLVARSFRLGTFEGGFQTFVDALTGAVTSRGGQLLYNRPVHGISTDDGGRLMVTAGEDVVTYDQVLVTTSPSLLARMAPQLPRDYLGRLLDLKSLGAVVLILALKHQLMTDGTYWLNIPASSPIKSENEVPFLALVEHTNYVDSSHFGNDHIVYCGDYVVPDHEYLTLPKAEIESRFVAHLKRFNPRFQPDWVTRSWLYRTRYAQPVPTLNHSQNIPAIQTPVSNLYFASMSQVYPWDRGTNFAVQIGRHAARLMTYIEAHQ
jgi:protoporphyrinogen oxidase